MKKRIMSLVLAVVMLVCMMPSATALSTETDVPSFSEKAMRQVIEVTNSMIEASNYEIVATNMKLLNDFSGNTYTLIECEPTGYYILDDDTGVYVEYSGSAPSPYKEYKNGESLYYGGPTYYYINENGTFKHTILSFEVLSSNEVSQMQVQSQEMNCALEANPDSTMLAALSGNSFARMSMESEPSRKYVDNPDFFMNYGTGFGYASGGICGYIAANLLLQYWQDQGKFTLPYDQAQISNAELTLELYRIGVEELGLSAGTTGWDIASVINAFCKKNKLPEVAAWGLGQYDVSGEIDIKRPSILFGAFENNNAKNHAVVVYGYQYGTTNGRKYIAHFGWDDYPEVIIEPIAFGSNTCYRMDV